MSNIDLQVFPNFNLIIKKINDQKWIINHGKCFVFFFSFKIYLILTKKKKKIYTEFYSLMLTAQIFLRIQTELIMNLDSYNILGKQSLWVK